MPFQDQVDDDWRTIRVHAPGAPFEALGPWFLVRAIWDGLRVLTAPADSSWIVELEARGRIRRGAIWRSGPRADAERVLATVAEAVHLGHVPRPERTLLIDVVDHRLTVHGALR